MRYTSNYSRKGNDPTAISISFSVIPRIRENCPQLQFRRELGPNWPLLSKWKANLITQDEYAYEYLDLLARRNLSPQGIVDSLPENCYLLCYEGPFEFCHRHILTKYIYEGTGIAIPEWLTEEEEAKFKKAAKQEEYVDTVLEF